MEHINTLENFDRLVASGVSEEQARAHVYALNSSFDGVATKQDLELLEKDIKNDIKQQIKELEYSLKVFVGAIIFGSLILGFILPKVATSLGW